MTGAGSQNLKIADLANQRFYKFEETSHVIIKGYVYGVKYEEELEGFLLNHLFYNKV
jgi:hypothetical protein